MKNTQITPKKWKMNMRRSRSRTSVIKNSALNIEMAISMRARWSKA
jgi:hypothetical protein